MKTDILHKGLTTTLGALGALAVATPLLTGAAQAQSEKLDLKGLTCERFLDLDTAVQPRYVYWLDGYTQAGNEVYEVDTDWMAKPVVDVVTECKRDPGQTAADAVEKTRQANSG